MHLTLIFIQFLNLILSISSIVYGLYSLKYLKERKLLLLIPVYSIIQVLFSELGIKFFEGNYFFGSIQYLSVTIYIIIEYVIIICYFKLIYNSYSLRRAIIYSIIVSLFALFFDVWRISKTGNFNIYFFQFFSGFTIETLAFLGFREFFKKVEIENIFLLPNSIMTSGIFFAFMIITPFAILQNFLISKNNIYYELLFLTNCLGYFILFSFLIFSIYVSRKSRDF